MSLPLAILADQFEAPFTAFNKQLILKRKFTQLNKITCGFLTPFLDIACFITLTDPCLLYAGLVKLFTHLKKKTLQLEQQVVCVTKCN